MAMAYLRAGLSINPLNGKVPAVPDWTKFAHQLPTTDHVSVWWHEHPTANLGIVCVGRSYVRMSSGSPPDTGPWVRRT